METLKSEKNLLKKFYVKVTIMLVLEKFLIPSNLFSIYNRFIKNHQRKASYNTYYGYHIDLNFVQNSHMWY